MRQPYSVLILAGGASRRMGTAKTDLMLGGQSLLQRTCEVALGVSDDVLVVGRTAPAPHPSAGSVEDDIPGGGPLAGLASGLSRIRYSSAVLLACDHPFLTEQFVDFVATALAEYQAAVPNTEGRDHPTLCAYDASCLAQANALLGRSERRLSALLDCVRTRRLGEDELRAVDSNLEALINVNTPQDWRAALKRAGGGSDIPG